MNIRLNFSMCILLFLLIISLGVGCDINSSHKNTIGTDPVTIEPQDVCNDFNGGEGSLCDDFNGDTIDTSVWQVASWQEEGLTSPDRCYVRNGILNLIFIYSPDDPSYEFLSAAIQTWSEFGYGRWEARLKPTSVAGVLNSLYTIDWDDLRTETDADGSKEEIDIEFLTNSFGADSGEVHYAVHESGSTSYDTNPDIDLDFNPSGEPHVWGFNITPGYIEWFVDETVLQTYTYSEGDISIDEPYQLKLNVWSQHGDWVGGPPPANTECVYQIDWIRFTPNTGG